MKTTFCLLCALATAAFVSPAAAIPPCALFELRTETPGEVLRLSQRLNEYRARAAVGWPRLELDQQGEDLVRDCARQPALLHRLALTILDTPGLVHRDCELASIAAHLAYCATGGRDSRIAATYARTLFVNGNFALAVFIHRPAAARCTDPGLQGELQSVLKYYEEHAKTAQIAALAAKH